MLRLLCPRQPNVNYPTYINLIILFIQYEGIKKSYKKIPKHVVPFPVCPSLQAQVNEPSVSAHVALTAQLWVVVFDVHSLMFEQLRPFPRYPVSQAQV